MKKTTSLFAPFAVGVACLLASAAVAPAQFIFTWNGGTGNWSNPAVWTPALAPNTLFADVSLDGGKAVLSVVTMDASFSVGRLTVDGGDTLNLADSTALAIFAGGFSGSGSLVNNGNVNFGNAVDLQLGGNVTLAGTGTTTLNSSGNDRIYAADTAGDRLTVGAGQTIQGAGNIGNGGTTMTNNGTIIANQAAPLILQPGGGTEDFTNSASGVLRATGGSLLRLNGANGTFINNGLIEAVAGPDSLVQISGGVFTNNGSIRPDASSQVQLINNVNVMGGTLADAGRALHSVASTLTGVTNNGDLILDTGSSTTLVGTLTNNATVTFAGFGASYVTLQLSGNVTLAGPGTMSLDSSGYDYIYANVAGDRLTVGAGQTIQGAGYIGNGGTTMTNNGTIIANQASALILQPGGGTGDFTNSASGVLRATGGSLLRLNGANGAFINNGLIEAVAGPDSLVQISGGVFTNNGSIRPDASSQVQLINNVNVMGGTLADAGRALYSVASTLTGVTNNGDLILDTGSSTTLVGTLTNNATVTFAGFGASYVTLQLSGNVTLAGPGTMSLDSSGYDYIYAVTAGDRLTVGAGQTIQGAGRIGNGGTTMTNHGTIIANQASALILQPGGGTGDFTNSASGVLRATGGSILQLNGANGAFINNGLIEAVAGPDSLVQISGGVFTNNGSIRPDASSQVQLINNVNVMGGTLADAGRALHSVASTLTGVTNNGDLILDTGSSTTLVGTLTNNATVTFAGFGTSYVTLQLSGNVTLAGPGTMTLDSFGYDYIYAVTAGDRLTVGAGQTIQGAGYIGNGGTTVTNRGTIIANQANALILQPGGGTGDFTNSASGVLRATGGSILRLNGANGAFINNGLFDVQNGSTMSVSSGALPNNQGVIHVTGGTFDTNNGVLTNDHEISGFGSFRTGGLTNKGTMAFTGGTATVNGSVTNNSNATITVASTTATFDSTLTNNGSYVSNVSTQNFTNLVVGPTGSITAGAGDVFNVLGNVTNNSTQNTAFDVSQAKFVMQGPGSHQFTWPGANTPDARAFAIGTLEVQSGGSATINLSGTGSGLIIGLLQIDNGATVIFGDGMALAGDPGGVGKFDAGFGSVGGGRVGHLASPATVPEPGAIGLLFAGAAGLLTRRRRR